MQIPQADFVVAMPGYFRTLEVPLHAGRDFSAHDQYDAEFVAIVNEALVRKSFPGQNPLGRKLQCGLDNRKYMTIVGVAADFRSSDPALPARPAIYMPYLQHPFYATRVTFAIKTAADPMSVAEAVRRTVREVNSEIPVQFTTMDARLSDTVASPRFRSILLGIFAGLAVLLAMAGVYGVMAYTVGQRTSEIGLRMALGADSGSILKLVLSGGVRLAAIGMVLGLVGALGATRLLETMLYGVTHTDPATYLGIAAAVAVTALAACAVPAWRATRVDPLEALRQE
jgi:predicted permease